MHTLKTTLLAATLCLSVLSHGETQAFQAQPTRSVGCQEAKGGAQVELSRDARIVSLEGFDRYVEAHESALDFLTDEGFEIFRDSLEFNEKGLTTFRYDVLKDALSEAEFGAVMRLFGLYPETAMMADGNFLLDHFCNSVGTCEENAKYACTSNC